MYIFLTQSTWVVRVILTIKGAYFPKQYSMVALCKGEWLCSLKDMK